MSHRCDSVIERLGAFIDGELDESARIEVETHLASCDACRALRDDLAALDSFVRHGMAAEPAEPREREREEAALGRTLERLREEPEPEWARSRSALRSRARSPRWGFSWRWAIGMAAATAAILLALRITPDPIAPGRRIAVTSKTETTAPGRDEDVAAQMPAEEMPTDQEPVRQAPAPISTPRSAPTSPAAPVSGSKDQREVAPSSQPDPVTVESFASSEAQEGAVRLESVVEDREMKVRASKGEATIQLDAPEELAIVKDAVAPPGAARDAVRGETSRISPMFKAEPNVAGKAGVTFRGSPVLDGDWYLRVGAQETTAVVDSRRSEIESISATLLRDAEGASDSPAGERADLARRARALGDLWESIGRREKSSAAYDRAAQLYRVAGRLDRQAAGLDSNRVQRARSGGK